MPEPMLRPAAEPEPMLRPAAERRLREATTPSPYDQLMSEAGREEPDFTLPT